MKKEEKINKALLLIEQLTNKKPVLKEKTEPVTKQVVDEAMRIVSKDVLAPKVVRDGLLKETIEKPIKRRFYAVTDDFEKQAKRLITFYNDMLTLHPELKPEVNKIKRALGSIEQTFTNTEMFINENKKEEQLELDFEKEETLQEDVAGMTTGSMAVVDSGPGIKPSERKKKKLQEAYNNSVVSVGDTVDTRFGKLVVLANPQFGRSKYRIPVMSLDTFNSLATTKRVDMTNVPVEFLTVNERWMTTTKPGLKVPTEHLKKVWNLYVGKKDEIETKKSEIKQKKYDAAAPLINYSTKDYGWVVTMVDGKTAKVGDRVDVRFSNGVFSGVIKSIAGRADGAVGILFRGRTKAKMVAPKIILRKTGSE